MGYEGSGSVAGAGQSGEFTGWGWELLGRAMEMA